LDNTLVLAALLSAALHAAWNAAVKAHAHPPLAMTAQMLASAALALPLLLWTGAPERAAWPWMVASTLFGMGAVAATLRAYEHGGFGVVYPISRAASVLLVLPLAAATAGEWPQPLALLGVALVSAAVLLLARGQGSALSRATLGWTLAAAAFTAGYIVCDAQGVRRAGSALAYGCTLATANALLWTGWQNRRGLRLAELGPLWRRSLAVAAAAMSSYLLILWVWTQAPIALGSALRDTSAIFATLIAIFVLKERVDRRVLWAVALATAGTAAIRLG
jgi:drug/metabolite transporter (DMT)-like permease